jgi:hypothetical protein
MLISILSRLQVMQMGAANMSVVSSRDGCLIRRHTIAARGAAG